MVLIKKLVLTVLSFITIVYTVSVIINFTKFLSDFSPRINTNLTTNSTDVSGEFAYPTEALAVDVSLLCVFIIVHSSLIPVQEIMSTIFKMPVLNKMFYSLLTSASLQLLMRMWVPITQYTLWNIETQDTAKLFVFRGIHIFCWTLIYVMMITMDITDLLGVKQVYHYMTGRPVLPSVKPEKLRHLYRQMRHPSFLGFTIIFWIHPCMSLDRLFLASLWSLYMLLVWRPDTYSYNYIVQQSVAKRSVL